MAILSVRGAAMSMAAASLVAALPAAAAAPAPWSGRWTVADDKPVFTARGRPYQTIDVAPCGGDVCGVSVGAGGRCGAALFRFSGRQAGEFTVHGHGRWGAERKNVVIERYDGTEQGPAGLDLYLGDGYDVGGRSGSMPKFNATYRRTGAARCTAR